MADDNQKSTDAFDLSNEEFEALKTAGPATVSLEPEPEPEPKPESDSQSEKEPESEDLAAYFEPEEKEEKAGEPKSTEEEVFTLLHGGKVITLPKSKVINLAQQGFDYQEKTTKLAPYRRLIKLVEDDPELQEKINNHVVSKKIPSLAKREDFETEDEWLKANMTTVASKMNPAFSTETEGTATSPSTEEAPIVRALKLRDPEHFTTVAPHLVSAIKKLTMEQYQSISNDPAEVVKFYDFVKARVLSPPAKAPLASGQPVKKTFNLRSGMSRSSAAPEKKNIWELSNKDFDRLTRKVKEY